MRQTIITSYLTNQNKHNISFKNRYNFAPEGLRTCLCNNTEDVKNAAMLSLDTYQGGKVTDTMQIKACQLIMKRLLAQNNTIFRLFKFKTPNLENNIAGLGIITPINIIFPCYKAKKNIGYILDVCIHPSVRGQGNGKTLIKQLIDDARNLNYSELVLIVEENNKVARKIYEDAGFITVKNKKLLEIVSSNPFDKNKICMKLDLNNKNNCDQKSTYIIAS